MALKLLAYAVVADVPEEHLKMARRFNTGESERVLSPGGTVETGENLISL